MDFHVVFPFLPVTAALLDPTDGRDLEKKRNCLFCDLSSTGWLFWQGRYFISCHIVTDYTYHIAEALILCMRTSANRWDQVGSEVLPQDIDAFDSGIFYIMVISRTPPITSLYALCYRQGGVAFRKNVACKCALVLKWWLFPGKHRASTANLTSAYS